MLDLSLNRAQSPTSVGYLDVNEIHKPTEILSFMHKPILNSFLK